ncbi:M64 family metallopeptidase [Dyadobacter sp. MSC1_007]|jgi:hypothetical protein|uniref:M64 family metallopeptidase n=1 Tax=Dyadobacter sp. MSC1_007 TaxID=2909264 RepID=UPI00202E8441|nr:M64 family metallopeptidase [Dyadobacter sp. MSC1_007]
MKSIFYTLCAFCWCTVAFGQEYKVDTLYKAGPLNNRINVIILGDGFTKQEMPKFSEEARKFADFFRGFEPFNRYRNYFNFFAIGTPSKESGITNPGTATDAYPDQPVGAKDTFLGVSFGAYIHKLLLMTKYDAFGELMATHFPMYDLIVVLANTTYVGGSGGNMAIYTLQAQSNRVGIHEVGHTLGKLSDEYWFVARESANMTTNDNPATIKWKNWLDYPPIGIYKYGSGDGGDYWHKPSPGECIMEFVEKEFCAVCREEMIERILELVNPIDQVEPENAGIIRVDGETHFKLTLVKPDPSTLQIEWRLNGNLIANGVDVVTLDKAKTPDLSTLTATVFDSTKSSRRNSIRHLRTKTVSWSLRSQTPALFKVVMSRDKICAGDSVTIDAYGCAGALSWSTGETSPTISVMPAESHTSYAYCKVDGQPTVTIATPITVLPLPAAVASNDGPYLVGATVKLSAQGGDRYEWSGPRNFSANTANASIPDAGFNNAGIYKVKVTGENGCSKTAQTEVKVDPILSTSTNPEEWLRVSPNPAEDCVFVETVLPGKSLVVIYDQSGRKVISKSFTSKTNIPFRLPAGLYLYRFTNGSRASSGRILVR